METHINDKVIQSIVPISDLNRGGAAKVIESLHKEQGEKIIVRNNKPVAVLLDINRYLALIEGQEQKAIIYSLSDIKDILHSFCEQNGMYGDAIHSIYLFGSYARGEATIHSDIDLLVDIDKAKIHSRTKNIALMNLYAELEKYFKKSVDVVYTTHIPEKMRKNIKEDKVKVYG